MLFVLSTNYFLHPQVIFVSINFRKRCKERGLSTIELERPPVYESKHQPVMSGHWKTILEEKKCPEISTMKSMSYSTGYWTNGPLCSGLDVLFLEN